MMISSRGRYALRVMIDLAEHQNDGFIPMKDVVGRQDVSQKYVEHIMVLLSKNGLVEGVHGKGGGYRLNRPPEAYRVGEILRLTEGTLAPVACLECGAKPCQRAAACRTLPMWSRLDHMIGEYLDSITIADLMKQDGGDGYVI
ncbi:MAG: RrF2 family transcriptional regulator [Oscillospiraceae bacterium]|nr:RrF2 family transcriptional regulator [Oscillospiraceae bacterium]